MVKCLVILAVGLVVGAHWNAQVNGVVAKVVNLVKGLVAKLKS